VPLGETDLERRLEANPWFAGLSKSRRRQLLDNGNPMRFDAGERVYRIGDPPKGFNVVAAGEVRLFDYPSLGKQMLLLVLRPGDWFGELSVIDGGPRPHDAVCQQASVIHQVPLAAIATIARDDPGIYRDIALLNAHRQRMALARISLMWRADASIRLARVLSDLAAGVQPDEGECVEVRINQEDLGSMVGISRQRLNRLLKEFEIRSLIRVSYGKIAVLSPLLRAGGGSGWLDEDLEDCELRDS